MCCDCSADGFSCALVICAQRAERLEAVRRHVRSRISEQNQLDHRESEAASASRDKSPSLILNTTDAQDQGAGQSQEHTPGKHVTVVFTIYGSINVEFQSN